MGPSSVDFELATLQSVATALAQLDPAARARTLQWLRQRFELDVTSAPPESASPAIGITLSALRMVAAPLAASDEALSVETLGDLFHSRDTLAAKPEPPAVSGVLTEFVAEFQQIAREWEDACAAPDADDPDDALPLLSAAS